MSNYSVPIMKKKFSEQTKTKAYIKAMKWAKENVLDVDELQNVFFNFEYEKQSPSVIMTLFISININDVRKRHCELCKELHKQFYIDQPHDCKWCKLQAFHDRADHQIKIKKEHYKKLLMNSVEKNKNGEES